ncbi:MAG: flagellar biosynthetic protein FliO [Novosphingobium sp.]
MRRTLASLGALLLVLPGGAWAQDIGQNHGSLISPWRIIASLAFCLVLGGAAIFMLRRYSRWGNGAPSRANPIQRLRVVEQRHLGPQRSICLIEIDGHGYAAIFAAQAVSLVTLPREPSLRDVVAGEPAP